MSEVKRYLADEQYPGQYSARCDLVPASAYDAAQSQLAALREELAVSRSDVSTWRIHYDRIRGERDDLHQSIIKEQQRLADAERRNSELVGLLRSVWECSEVKGDEWKRIDFYLNPNQEASSHD